jgi:ribosome-associated toxin RatA of RatAB toxin-antitoxin module
MITGNRAVQVAAEPAAVFARLCGLERYPQWQSFVTDVDVRERDGDGRPTLIEAKLDAKVTTLRAVLRYAYDEPTTVSFTYEDGDVKDMHGSFTLVPGEDAGSTRVTMAVAVDPGFRLGLLLRGPAADRVRDRVLGGTLDGLAGGFAAAP